MYCLAIIAINSNAMNCYSKNLLELMLKTVVNVVFNALLIKALHRCAIPFSVAGV